MEVAESFKMLAVIYKTARSHITEDHNLNIHYHENLKFPVFVVIPVKTKGKIPIPNTFTSSI
jgi:hypothetical protein